MEIPGGIKHRWIGEDPLLASSAEVDPKTGNLKWPGGFRGSRDIYVVPNKPILDVLPHISVKGRIGSRSWEVLDLDIPVQMKSPKLTAHGFTGGGTIEVSLSRAPVPTRETRDVVGHDDEMQEMLKALGYVTGNSNP